VRKVSGSRPDAVQEKKRKKDVKSLDENERRMELGKEENRRRDSARAVTRNQILFYSYSK